MATWARVFILIFSVAIGFSAASSIAKSEEAHGDWIIGIQNSGDGPYATTVNDSGLLLGEYCYFKSQSCTWLLGADTSCEENHVYPTLGNTDQGTAPLELLCLGKVGGTSGQYVYAFRNWEKLEELIKKSARLGLAVPLQSDNFKVWRFSLKGMLTATGRMEAAFFSTLPKSQPATQRTTTSTL